MKVPKLFQELFGIKTTRAELIIVMLTCTVLSSVLLVYTYGEWGGLALWVKILLILFTLDITGGVVANLTEGTNQYYRENKRMRNIFIAIHIQPLLLGWLLGDFRTGLAVWTYTIIATILVIAIETPGIQRTAGMTAALIGVGILVTTNTSFILSALLALYMVKLMFSFAVDHQLQ